MKLRHRQRPDHVDQQVTCPRVRGPVRHPAAPLHHPAQVRQRHPRKIQRDALVQARILLDQRAGLSDVPNGWLAAAAKALEAAGFADRVTLESTSRVIDHESAVLGYYSWGFLSRFSGLLTGSGTRVAGKGFTGGIDRRR